VRALTVDFYSLKELKNVGPTIWNCQTEWKEGHKKFWKNN
jgi:hypothetical protein